ncbi:MAG: superinfection immunity protein [Comamonas sp.]
MRTNSKNLLIGIAAVSGIVALLSLAGGGGGAAILLGVMLALSGAAYFIPSFVAFERAHDNGLAVFWLNFLLGWALLPWVAALIWALTRNRAVELIEQHRGTPAPAAVAPLAGDTRTCPFCAETVKAAAKLCKHCRSELPPLEATSAVRVSTVASPPTEPEKPQGVCPNCRSAIALDSDSCPSCKAAFGVGSNWAVEPIRHA